MNTLGVFLIRPNGDIADPRIVFPQIEQTEGDPNSPMYARAAVRSERTRRVLSELYDPGQLHPGQEFGLFLIAHGFTLNGDALSGDLRFADDGRTC